MNYIINDDTTDFTFGTAASHYFEFGFDSGSLREFVKLGIKALREMDAQAVQKNAQNERQDDGADAGELVSAGERSA